MSDIFISYAKKDISIARELASLLKNLGWSVWWDRNIPVGKKFAIVIGEAVDAARCIVVLWSKRSVKSQWVIAEASEGLERDILVPVSLDDVRPPLIFRQIQTANLSKWDGSPDTPSIKRFVDGVLHCLGPPQGKRKKRLPRIQTKKEITAKPAQKKVFISYSSADRTKVEKLVTQLKSENDIEVWFDADQIFPGDDFVDAMEAAITYCDKFLICLSPSFENKSPHSWVRKEFRMKMIEKAEKEESILIPIRIKRGGKIPYEIGTRALVDLTTKRRWQKNYSRLLKAIKK